MADNTSIETGALIVRIPELDRVISGIRYLAGVPEAIFPAHVTVMAPFPSFSSLSPDQVRILSSCCESIEGFEFTLDSVAWFEQEVVYFHLDREEKFLDLTEMIGSAFGVKPYEGKHASFIPHVTVALNDTSEHLDLAAQIAEVCLPVSARAEKVVLWEKNTDGKWCSTYEAGFRTDTTLLLRRIALQ